MVARELLDPDSSMWHWLASDLHFYRSKHEQTLAYVGSQIGLSRGAVSNLEAARDGFTLQSEQAKKLDQLWDLNNHFARLLRYAERDDNPEWRSGFEDRERRAAVIKNFGLNLVPGLLQTAAYAEALIAAARLIHDIDKAVAARLSRQQILKGPNAPELWVLLNQGVLDQPVGGREVMRGQLSHLLDTSMLPNVVLRVIPREVGAHVGLEGEFTILQGQSYGRVAYMEAVGGGRLSEDRAEVDRYTVRFDRIGADALSRESSRHLIMTLMETMQ